MAFSIFGRDNEFAVSTGSNVNDGPGTSSFDYPPNSSMDLVITTHDSDSDPRLFEVGDSYDIAWGGAGGANSILNATVIRSDNAPDQGGVVVFEGIDAGGSTVQVVWTPFFDLETWYFDNFMGGTPPSFYTADQNAAYTHEYVCFAADTPITTRRGRVAADSLGAGDKVRTLDHGHVALHWVARRQVSGLDTNAPVLIPPGPLGNDLPLRLSRQHRVMLRGPGIDLLYGLPEVLAPASALVPLGLARLAPVARITYVHLLMPAHEVIFAAGAPCETLFLGDVALARLYGLGGIGCPGALGAPRAVRPARPILTGQEARALTRADLGPGTVHLCRTG